MGPRASEAAQKLFQANDYTEYLYLHGLGVETAEALAEFWHKRIRQELGIAGEDSPAHQGTLHAALPRLAATASATPPART